MSPHSATELSPSSHATFLKDFQNMKRVIRIALICVLVSTASAEALAQRRIANNTARKSAARAPQILCKGKSVPTGYVIVGYRSSAKCGENPELVTKKPAEAEIVCVGSPIPDGYHVANRITSTDCIAEGSNSSDALSIVSNGSIGLGSANRSNLSYDRFEDVTRVQMPEELLYREARTSEFDPEEIYISAAYAYRGQAPSLPSSVTLFFRVRVLFDLGFDSVTFIADGQRFAFGSVLSTNKADSVENKYGGYTTYSNCTYAVAMSLDNFRRIVNSNNVEMRAAGREFNLTGGAMGSLRAFEGGIKR
jgi:hypothetical protein